MIAQRLALLFLSSLGFLASSSEAYALCRPSTNLPTTRLAFRPSTCLRSADTDEASKEPSDSDDGSKTEEKAKSEDAATDILNSPAFLKRKLEVIQSDTAKVEENIEAAKTRLEEGKAEWGSQIGDLEKEYILIQQRMSAQSNKTDDMSTTQVARQVLEVIDTFDRAFGAVTAETDAEKEIEVEYRKAYDMVFVILEKLGVEEVTSVGTEFDYELHQAVMQKPSDEYEEGIVCEELQKGFKIDTLIRAAMVVVAA